MLQSYKSVVAQTVSPGSVNSPGGRGGGSGGAHVKEVIKRVLALHRHKMCNTMVPMHGNFTQFFLQYTAVLLRIMYFTHV